MNIFLDNFIASETYELVVDCRRSFVTPRQQIFPWLFFCPSNFEQRNLDQHGNSGFIFVWSSMLISVRAIFKLSSWNWSKRLKRRIQQLDTFSGQKLAYFLLSSTIEKWKGRGHKHVGVNKLGSFVLNDVMCHECEGRVDEAGFNKESRIIIAYLDATTVFKRWNVLRVDSYRRRSTSLWRCSLT